MSLSAAQRWAHAGRIAARWPDAYGPSLWGAGGVQQLVVEALSLWPHGVVVARHDLRQVPGDAQRGRWGDDRGALGGVLVHHIQGLSSFNDCTADLYASSSFALASDF